VSAHATTKATRFVRQVGQHRGQQAARTQHNTQHPSFILGHAIPHVGDGSSWLIATTLGRRGETGGMARPPLDAVTTDLRQAGARFAFLHGSVPQGRAREDSDLDVAGWWGGSAPAAWEVPLPDGTDLTVLDEAPLWLAGRIALEGTLLFDDDPQARVAWQADTRLQWLDERPFVLQRQRAWREAVARGR